MSRTVASVLEVSQLILSLAPDIGRPTPRDLCPHSFFFRQIIWPVGDDKHVLCSFLIEHFNFILV